MKGQGEEPKRIKPLGAGEKARLESQHGAEDDGTREALAVKQQTYSRNLKHEAEANDHDRKEHFREHFERIIIIMMWAIALGFLTLALIWLLNLIAPAKCRWLTEREIFGIQGILTGGLIIGLVSDHIKRRTQQ